jgi:hypothetical protein
VILHFFILAPTTSWIVETKTKKGSIFWDITLCSPLKIFGRFGGTHRAIFWVEERDKQETRTKQLATQISSGYSQSLQGILE